MMRGASLGMVPLTEMSATNTYKGEDGGLYGKGLNEPPESHMKLALAAAAQVRPLDINGKPDENGTIGLVSIGMSNTTQSFTRFMELVAQDTEKSPRLRLVDGAQNGRTSLDWAYADDFFLPQREPWHPWRRLAGRLAALPVTPAQVQVAWVKLVRGAPGKLGEFPAHARVLNCDLALTVIQLRRTFPNLQLVYLSSRTYAGHATSPLNPEPYAYESAFAVRWLILDQIAGRPELNADPDRDKVHAPVLLWGPYLWCDGQKPRQADGLTWTLEDSEADGTHPSMSGRGKIAGMLMKFFKNDPTARSWFLAAP